MMRYGGVCQEVRPEVQMYLERLRLEGKTEQTRKTYGRTVRELSLWLNDRGRTLLTATPADLLEWRAQMRHAPNTVLTYVTAMRSFYRWAVRGGLLTTDPSADVPAPPRRRGRPRPIPEDRLVMAIVNAPPRIKPWLLLAALAGLRAREIADLQRDDILETAAPPVMVIRGKGNRERVVPLSPQLWAALVEAGLPRAGHVFLRVDGAGPNTAHRISCVANAYLHSIGITETLHQLRHRFATQAYKFGQDLRQVQELLGHASPTTTAVYADYAQSQASATVAAVQLDIPGETHARGVPPRTVPMGSFGIRVEHPGADDERVRAALQVPIRVAVIERTTIPGYFASPAQRVRQLLAALPRRRRARPGGVISPPTSQRPRTIALPAPAGPDAPLKRTYETGGPMRRRMPAS